MAGTVTLEPAPAFWIHNLVGTGSLKGQLHEIFKLSFL